MSPATTTPRRLTIRAVATGALLGAPLAVCNIYAGLKIGWGFNMSVVAALAGYAVWRALGAFGKAGGFSIYESNISQTAASAAASISSAGLVTAVPALTIITGKTLSPVALGVWLLSVSLVGVVVAVALRRQFLEEQNLPFPHGVAAAELLKQLHRAPSEPDEGDHAASPALRTATLLVASVVAAAAKALTEIMKIHPPAFGGAFQVVVAGARTTRRLALASLGFAIEPGLLMVGAGAVSGARVGLSMLVGSLVTWLVIAPRVLGASLIPWPSEDATVYKSLVSEWLIWPGAALMVSASLAGFVFATVAMFRRRRSREEATSTPEDVRSRARRRRLWIGCAALVSALSVTLQIVLFGIHWWVAVGAVLMSFALAVVAARVSGETGITPKGPMGKLTQLLFGVVAPAAPAANLMTANVTAGAAAQCADLLHDLKTGTLIGAIPARQIVGQLFGVLVGAIVGGFVYPLLLPDPASTVGTASWPAPAVLMWKAIAELLGGHESFAPKVAQAVIAASALGVALAAAEHFMPKWGKRLLPGPTSLGLSMVLPPYVSLGIAAGGIGGLLWTKLRPNRKSLVMVAGSGFIAGDSLTGALLAAIATVRGV
ncbi:MAG: OPT/YSL family transporter [Myxococcales bacterium]|nr:OPT/YSL family transporter [Myxococcales bacterium]